jgi:uncharacterized protein YjeT (DUF2065 family)
MSYLETIKFLYVINGIAAILLYLPQIRNAVKNKSDMKSVSLITFGGWSIGSGVTVLYAWSFVQDMMFVAASLGSLLGASTMFSIVTWKRLVYGKGSQPARERSSSRLEESWFKGQRLAIEE